MGGEAAEEQPADRIPPEVVAVNYTSGSTGNRRAVAVTSGNLLALFACRDLDVPAADGTASGSFATPTYDGWWFDTWRTAAAGGTVVCLPNVNEDVFEWPELAAKYGIARLLLPAAAFAEETPVPPTWSFAIHGGAGTLERSRMTPEQQAEYKAALQTALDAGAKVLREGGARHRGRGVVILADRHGTGTNGLLLCPPDAIAPSFGMGSRERHAELAHRAGVPWTVEELAARVGLSRAALGRRFTAILGEPPMSYLAGWRLALAADMLVSSDATVAAIARQVGYRTPFSLSAAFKRVHGVSPQQYRLGRLSA